MASKEATYYTWDNYVREAARPDFVLKVSDTEEVRITNPTGVQTMRVSQGLRNGDLDAILVGLTGDQYPRMVELLSSVGHEALPKLVEDLMDHFHMYDEVELRGPGGGIVKASRPTKIQQLIRAGYVPVGEALS